MQAVIFTFHWTAYVSQFLYHYDYDGLLNATVRLGYGNIMASSGARRKDGHGPQLPDAEIFFGSVNGKLDYVDLLITRDLDEEGISYMNFGGMPLALTGFATVAQAGINWYRLTFLVCGGGLIALLCFRDFVAKAHRGWISADLLTFGTIFSLSLPQIR